jgi:hypothetical protein
MFLAALVPTRSVRSDQNDAPLPDILVSCAMIANGVKAEGVVKQLVRMGGYDFSSKSDRIVINE